MEFKFSNVIDQKLFDLIVHSEPNFEKCREEAKVLLANGANINAESISGDVPDCFLLPAILSESSNSEPIFKSETIHFFLDNGFDPNLGEGRSGSLTLSHLIFGCIPVQTTLSDLKDLLDAGCNPSAEILLFEGEYRKTNAIDEALTGLADAFQVEFDLNYVLGFSAIFECLTKAGKNLNYKSIGLATNVCNSNIHGIYSFGNCTVSRCENEENLFSCIAEQHQPFEAGLIFECDRDCLLIDPFWGAYCDKELKNKLADFEKINLGLSYDYTARLKTISGKISFNAEFLIELWGCAIEITDKVIRIKDKNMKEAGRQNVASLLLPNGF